MSILLKIMNLRSLILKKIRLYNFKRNKNVQIHPTAHFGRAFKIDIKGNKSRLILSENFNSRGNCNLRIHKNAILKINKNVFLNNNCSINCLENIEIGENTILGEGIKIYDHNHKYRFDRQLVVEILEFTTGPVSIGKNCWLGSNVTILKGVTIGDNCIIGAHCLIYKSIPPNTVVKHKEELILS